MEAEVRQILRDAVKEEAVRAGPGLGSRIAAKFARGARRAVARVARASATAGQVRHIVILDTNVLSASMRSDPDPPVLNWLNPQAPQSVWITSITLFESSLGMALLPAGRRRKALESAFDRLLEEDLENRVLAFDSEAALQAAALAAVRQPAGRPVDIRDTQIAGIAQPRRASLATRNVRHFEGLTVSRCSTPGSEPAHPRLRPDCGRMAKGAVAARTRRVQRPRPTDEGSPSPGQRCHRGRLLRAGQS
jgi:toxin FitB